MAMVKQLIQMVNNSTLVIGVVLFLTGTLSCNNANLNESNDQNKLIENDTIDLKDSTLQNVSFRLDSTINGVLVLNDKKSSDLFLGEKSSKKLIERIRESPVLLFANKKGEEYLMLYQYEGGLINEFACFEVGYAMDLNNEMTSLDYDNFTTEGGVRLGLSYEELIKLKGKEHSIENGKIIYRVNDYANTAFLKRNNMPAYFLECTLKKNKIVNIKFGFDYP